MKKIFIVLVFIGLVTSLKPFAQDINQVLSKHLFVSLPAQPVVRTIDLPGRVKLEYAEQGDADGVPVIFLHGLGDSWHSFESVLSQLHSTFHAFAISQRGHGDSERPAKNYTPKDFAADVAGFIKQKNLKKAFIVGHSMGGIIAQQFAISYPELTRGLVIIGAGPEFKSNPGVLEFYEEVLKMEGSISRKFMDDFQKSTLSRPIDSSYYNLLVEEGLKVPLGVFKSALGGLMEVDLIGELKLISAPTLAFWGSKDAFFAFAGQQLLVDNIKNVKLIVYGNTGHALHWQEPKKFTGELMNFINTVSEQK